MMLFFLINSQSGVAYKGVAYKKAFNIVLQLSNHEEITFPHELIFVFIQYSFGAILSKNIVKSVVFGKGYK